jgi:hypothetical protein
MASPTNHRHLPRLYQKAHSVAGAMASLLRKIIWKARRPSQNADPHPHGQLGPFSSPFFGGLHGGTLRGSLRGDFLSKGKFRDQREETLRATPHSDVMTSGSKGGGRDFQPIGRETYG